MILVDTSIWVDHLQVGDRGLAAMLAEDAVWMHPSVLGELACGSIRNRTEILELLGNLPQVQPATDAEVLALVERNRLHGRGLGWIDVQLLAAAMLAPCRLWTRDRRLAAAARTLHIAHGPAATR